MLKMNKSLRPVILDTHVWIWLVNGDKQMATSHALDLIEKKAANQQVYVSIISVWEVGMLDAKGKIDLPYSCQKWINKALNAPGISLAQLTPEIVIHSTHLPGSFHGDPADQMILATASNFQATLITKDKKMLNYAPKNKIKTLPL